MKRLLHALAALWPERREKTEDRRREKTEECGREAAASLISESTTKRISESSRIGELVDGLALRAQSVAGEYVSPCMRESAQKDSPSNPLPKRIIVSKGEPNDIRLGEPLPIAQVLARMYLRSATQCIIGKATQASKSANPRISESASKSDSADQQISKLAPKLLATVVATLLAVFMCLMAAKQVSAQAEPAAAEAIKPLQIGDTIPEELWHLPLQGVNHPDGKDTITLNDYRDKKLIILDFWATWCAPCISSLYKLDTLQAQFQGELAIIPTTYEDPEKVEPFFAEKGWSLPTSVSQQTLKTYFPHRSLPHKIWIKDDSLLAITGAEYADSTRLLSIIRDGHPQMVMKNETAEYDIKKPLLISGNAGSIKNLLYQSTITDHLAGVSNNIGSTGRNYVSYLNQTIATLYRSAYADLLPFEGFFNRIVFDVADSVKDRLIMPKFSGDQVASGEWFRGNSYCYQLFLPVETPKSDLHAQMANDLNIFLERSFGITGKVEKRIVQCIALELVGSAEGIKSLGAKANIKTTRGNRVYTNVPIQSFIRDLIKANLEIGIPIVDHTRYSANVDLEIGVEYLKITSNFDQLNAQLRKNGLMLVYTDAPLDMLVFKNIDNQLTAANHHD